MANNKQLTTVELFAGIGGFRIGAEKNKIKTVWANDINSDSVKVYKDNYGENSIVQGDINTLIGAVPNHDILTGGFPCQPFSKAGKKLGIKDYRGTLFESIVKILERKKPNYFILENVNSLLTMDKGENFKTILTALMGQSYKIEWRVFNAESFGLPQHRERVVILGSRVADFDQSYFLTKEDLGELDFDTRGRILDFETWYDIQKINHKFTSWGMAMNNRIIMCNISQKQYMKKRKIKDILQKDVDNVYFFNEDTAERIKDSVYVNKFYNGVQILYNQSGGARMGYSIFGVNGLSPTLTASTSRHYERYKIDNNFRRLTNVEYARIQGFPDEQCKAMKPYNQYKLYGNAVPPALVGYAFSRIKNNMNRTIKEIENEL